MGLVFFMALGGLWARLLYVQVYRHEHYCRKADDQHFMTVPIMPRRGRVFDRNGEELAVSKFMDSVYADGREITKQRRAVAVALGRIFDTPYESMLKRLSQGGIRPIARKVSLEKVREARDLIYEYDLSPFAIYSVKESKRAYPNGPLAAHVLGFTTTDDSGSGDNKGLGGIERQYDDALRGNWARFTALRNAMRRSLEPATDDMYFSTFGQDLVLTLDAAIQRVAERELARAVDYEKANGGALIVMDCRTGAVLAMANYPSYNPNVFFNAPAFTRRNRCVTDMVETGSVMKVFLTATLLEKDLLRVDELVDCQHGSAVFNGISIRDTADHAMDIVPFCDVFRWSSNVGAVTVAQRLAPALFADMLQQFGFGRKTGIDLPGEIAGAAPSPLTPVARDAWSFGYGLGVTAIQVAAAMSAIANCGVTVKPHIVREIRDARGKLVQRFEPPPGRRVISRVAAKKTLELMERVVEDGTASRHGKIEGYRVGGKTGTSLKVDPKTGQYSRALRLTSYVCVAPIDDPRLVIYCYIDEPKRNQYGGTVAAPVVSEVAAVALRVMGVIPMDPRRDPGLDAELIVERARRRRQALTQGALPEPTIEKGRMPDLRGLTMAEARRALASVGVDARFEGVGIVREQDPDPGARLNIATRARLVFARSGDPSGAVDSPGRGDDDAHRHRRAAR